MSTPATPTGTVSTSAAASEAVIVSMIGGVSELKGLDLGEESLHLGLLCGVGLIDGSESGGVLCGCGCAFVLVYLEARHHLIHDDVGVVIAQFVNCSSSLFEFKARFTEFMFKMVPCFVHLVGAFPRLDVVFED